MKVIGESDKSVFPMKIRCQYVVDSYGNAYGNEVDFCRQQLEIKESDIKKHPWFKYPDKHGVDYGVVCPVCRMFVMLDEDKIPGYVKQAAKEISLQHGKYTGKMEDL